MTNNVREMSLVRLTTEADVNYRAGFWVVEILSPVSGWIVQGVHTAKNAAEADRKNWM